MLTRIRLAGYSLLITWLINTLCEFICRWGWGSGAKFPALSMEKLPGLSFMTAPVFLLTYLFFAMPLAGCCQAAWQLCFWYMLLLAAAAWALLTCSLLFHASLREIFGPWPSAASLIWFEECALVSVTIYLLLLRAAVRRTYPA